MTLELTQPFQLTGHGWIHLAAKGCHPWVSPDGREKITQVIDNQSLESMVGRFKELGRGAKLLIDYDHQSHDLSQRTTAAGWIEALEVRDDGLWGLPHWTAQGLEDVRGGHYRFISPTFGRADCQDLGEGMLRPLRLLDVALTNKPNLSGLCPITNAHAKARVEFASTLKIRRALGYSLWRARSARLVNARERWQSERRHILKTLLSNHN